MEVSWCGSLGMDAERAPLGHGWPFGACLHHGIGGRNPCGAGADASATVLVCFRKQERLDKSDPAVRTEPDSAAPKCCCRYSIQAAALRFF